MKALYFERYGSTEVLQFKEIPKPSPKGQEVLIAVKAVSLNASDIEFLTARPVYIRSFGLFSPKYKILGSDVVGTVVEVGSEAGRFKKGDMVMGDILMHGMGALAEYVCAPETELILKHSHVSREDAATIPQAGVVALQGLRKGGVEEGWQVLINGAGGGSGSFAIQLAKILGAVVTGVDRGAKFEYMRSLGADHVIDYEKEDFTRADQKYDLVLDFVSHRSIFAMSRALSPTGRYVLVGGTVWCILQTLTIGKLMSRKGGKKLGMLLHRPSNDDLKYVSELMATNKVKSVISKKIAFEESIEAIDQLMKGNLVGKAVVTFG